MTTSRIGRSLRLLAPLLVLASIPAASSQAQDGAAPPFVGYEAVGSGTAYTTFPHVPAVLPFDAPFEATVALATATLSTGGQGFGRASTFFPGTPIAGFRPLIEVAGAPSGTGFPDYPIVVESREFEDEKHNNPPGFSMSSNVKPHRAVVIADAAGVSLPGVMGTGSSRTVSTSLVEPGSVSGSSTSTVNDMTFGAAVKVDSISSTSTVTSDATTSKCESVTTVHGVTVAGRPATVDEEGLHVDEEPAGPDLNIDPAGDALGASGVEMRVLRGAASCAGASGSQSTPGVLVSIPLPEPPESRYIMIIASTSATAGASTLPAYEPPPFDPPTLIGDVVTRLPGPAAGGALDPVVVPGAPSAAGPDAAPPLTGTPAGALTDYTFGGVPVVMVAGLFTFAVPGARRIRRYMVRVMRLVDPT